MALLIGTTYAWFSDTAKLDLEEIQAGTLVVDLVDADGHSLDGEVLNWVSADDSILWEPGATYVLPAV